MKYFYLLPLLIFPLNLMAWTNGSHHLEPLLNEVTSTKEPEVRSCENDRTYMSEGPRTEKWRKYYKLPKLLSTNMYKVDQICKDARLSNEMNKTNLKYALVVNKSHFCDSFHQACLSTLKSISDPCNYFIQNNFHVYHTCNYVNGKQMPKAKEILKQFGNLEPSLLVVRLSDCEIIPTLKTIEQMKKGKSKAQAIAENYNFTPPALDAEKDAHGIFKFKSQNEHIRFEAMKKSLQKNLPELKSLDEASDRLDCFEGGKRILPGVKDTDSIPYGNREIPGVMAVRKLMDEQIIEETKINIYK